MPKIKLVLINFLFFILMLTACQTANNSSDEGEPVGEREVAAAATETPEPTATASPVPTETSTPEPTPTATDTATPTPTDTPTTEPTETASPTRRATATPGGKPAATEENKSDSSESETEESEEKEKEIEPTAPPVKETDTELSPDEILQKSSEALNKIETITQEQNLILTTGFFTQTQHMVCQQDLPADGYCVVEVSTHFPGGEEMVDQSFELVSLDGQYWIREEGQDTWEELPEDLLKEAGFSDAFEESYNASLEFLTDPVLVGETEMDDQLVFEIQANVSDEIFAVMLNEETADQFLAVAEDLEIFTTLWVGKEDYVIRRQEVMISLIVEGESLEIVNKVTNSGINEPVEIPDPTTK